MADTLHQAEEAIRLEPCPWCGGTDLNSYAIEPHKHVFAGMPDHPGSHVIECFAPDCPAGCVAENEEAARAIWNRRPAQDADARDAARMAFERAMEQCWRMIDPFNPPPAGSYALGQDNGIIAALKTVRMNFERELSAMAQARKEGGNG